MDYGRTAKFRDTQRDRILTSLAVTFNASHSILGRMFRKKEGLYSMSERSSSASLKCKGNDRVEVLHALTAQVRKLTVRIFIVDS